MTGKPVRDIITTVQDDPHASLVEYATRGDEQALRALLERHLGQLTAYLRVHAGEHLQARESVADLAQSVCCEVLREADRFDYRGEPAFRKWLFQAALNKVRRRDRHWRTGRRDVGQEVAAEAETVRVALDPAAPSGESPSRVAMATEDLDRLHLAFARLDADDQQVLSMARFFGMSHREIAAEMDRSEGATRVLLHRAQFRLAQALVEVREQGDEKSPLAR